MTTTSSTPLIAVAAELEVSPAAVAIAWVQARPGVTSTIIGARTMDQLEQNLRSLDVALSPAAAGPADGTHDSDA